MEQLNYAIEWVIIFVLSATLHEGAHAFAAKIGGDLTAYFAGQVSFNPMAHIKRHPFGMLILPFISAFVFGWPFGFASVPYDPVWANNNPKKAAGMAAAGPAANLMLIIICVIVIKVGIAAGFFFEPDFVTFTSIVDAGQNQITNGVAVFLSMMLIVNLILFVLNLLPLPPLDGSGIFSLFLPEQIARKYRLYISNPAFGFIGLLVAWQVINPIIQAAFSWTINTIYWGAHFR